MKSFRIFKPSPYGHIALLIVFVAMFSATGPAAAAPLFLEISEVDSGANGYPEGSRYFALGLTDMRTQLSGAPLEDFDAPVAGLTIVLPLPTGESERYSVWESSILHPDLAAKFPEIKTYVGRGLDDETATVRLDTTPTGFHAMILSGRPTMFIDPVGERDAGTYASHFKRQRSASTDSPTAIFTCDTVEDPEVAAEIDRLAAEMENSLQRTTGTELRTYRIAIAATGEYTARHGGTVIGGMSGITTSLNRINGIYEREVAIRMELIANNDLVVYTNSATDPYTNGSGGTMLGQNQSNLDSVIGTANYDIGHVFSTGGGGIAGFGVVCVPGQKARGVTGATYPEGDNFDVDFVAHEMGHQFGGSHTFNGTSGNCSGGNRTASSAYEPGSGSTIMAYAGICGSQNLQNHSDDYFHRRSYVQIKAFTHSGSGSICPTITATGNNPPAPVAGNVGHTIPIDTPFMLVGEATDPDGDEMTHCWEEFDLGAAGHPNTPSGNAPIFRSYSPAPRLWRTFPKLPDLRAGTSTLGMLLPTYGRSLEFRFTSRDNIGGVNWDATTVDVDGGAGPFEVTSIGATPWDAGTTRTITWDVAGTDAAPVSCSTVNILLSTDDARDMLWDVPLAMGTPNDGIEVVNVPGFAITEARVMVEAADNVFFNVNDTVFSVTGSTGVEDAVASATLPSLRVHPSPFVDQTRIVYSMTNQGPVTIDVLDAAGRRVNTLLNGTRGVGSHSVNWSGRDQDGRRVASGVYFVRMQAGDEVRTTRVVHLD